LHLIGAAADAHVGDLLFYMVLEHLVGRSQQVRSGSHLAINVWHATIHTFLAVALGGVGAKIDCRMIDAVVTINATTIGGNAANGKTSTTKGPGMLRRARASS
jgi:hypothetical protein